MADDPHTCLPQLLRLCGAVPVSRSVVPAGDPAGGPAGVPAGATVVWPPVPRGFHPDWKSRLVNVMTEPWPAPSTGSVSRVLATCVAGGAELLRLQLCLGRTPAPFVKRGNAAKVLGPVANLVVALDPVLGGPVSVGVLAAGARALENTPPLAGQVVPGTAPARAPPGPGTYPKLVVLADMVMAAVLTCDPAAPGNRTGALTAVAAAAPWPAQHSPLAPGVRRLVEDGASTAVSIGAVAACVETHYEELAAALLVMKDGLGVEALTLAVAKAVVQLVTSDPPECCLGVVTSSIGTSLLQVCPTPLAWIRELPSGTHEATRAFLAGCGHIVPPGAPTKARAVAVARVWVAAASVVSWVSAVMHCVGPPVGHRVFGPLGFFAGKPLAVRECEPHLEPEPEPESESGRKRVRLGAEEEAGESCAVEPGVLALLRQRLGNGMTAAGVEDVVNDVWICADPGLAGRGASHAEALRATHMFCRSGVAERRVRLRSVPRVEAGPVLVWREARVRLCVAHILAVALHPWGALGLAVGLGTKATHNFRPVVGFGGVCPVHPHCVNPFHVALREAALDTALDAVFAAAGPSSDDAAHEWENLGEVDGAAWVHQLRVTR